MFSLRIRSFFALVIIAGLLVLARTGLADRAPVLCPLRRATGMPCGSCGLTRAAAAITRGEFAAAMHLHLASIPLTIIAAAWIGLLVVQVAIARPVIANSWRLAGRPFVWAVLALILLGWMVNLSRHWA